MNHLTRVEETYWQHFTETGQLGLVFLLVGLVILIHAFVPRWFKDVDVRVIRQMNKILDEEGV